MYKEEWELVLGSSEKKAKLLKNNPLGYFLAACLAGVYVGFGIILITTIGGQLHGAPYTKMFMGMSFGIALSLVMLAGSELFTGCTLVMTAGSISKRVSWADTLKVFVVCYIGNWVGSIVLAVLYHYSGLQTGPVAEFMAHLSYVKMSAPVGQLFIRGMLCNVLVCLAVWCCTKLKSESGKLIMIFWCLFAFITSSFEHSVANMTLLTLGLLEPMTEAITLNAYLTNILVVTVGNFFGAVLFLVLPYYIIQKDKH